jgi:hypothetical protein
MGQWGHGPADSGRSGSGIDDKNLGPGSSNSNQKPAAAPGEPQLNRNREQIQTQPDQTGHERYQ